LVGLWALALLSIATAIERVDNECDVHRVESNRIKSNRDDWITITSPQSTRSMALASRGLTNLVLFSFAPAIAIVTIFFFYALPRTTAAGQINNPSSAVVGFSDEVRLEQLGQMGQSTQIAALVRLSRRIDGSPYQPIAGIYVRGAVLENYSPSIANRPGGRSSAVWSASEGQSVSPPTSLPPEYYPGSFYERPNVTHAPLANQSLESKKGAPPNRMSQDSVLCQITYKASKNPSLFSIPPYYFQGTDAKIAHSTDRWTLSRIDQRYYFPRITYTFGTRAFDGGVQRDTHVPGVALSRHHIRQRFVQNPDATSQRQALKQQKFLEFQWKNYLDLTTSFDLESMSTIADVASVITHSGSVDPTNSLELAKAFEQHFSFNDSYAYSLNLNSDTILGMDPIEQFVAKDRRGHCQYFASALAMMLRSQGIPARLVVGYKTNEYDEIGERFIARQSHAHAWVEALIDRQYLEDHRIDGEEPWSEKYWLRLAPTPAANASRCHQRGKGVRPRSESLGRLGDRHGWRKTAFSDLGPDAVGQYGTELPTVHRPNWTSLTRHPEWTTCRWWLSESTAVSVAGGSSD
jgi:hypothetical protein